MPLIPHCLLRVPSILAAVTLAVSTTALAAPTTPGGPISLVPATATAPAPTTAPALPTPATPATAPAPHVAVTPAHPTTPSITPVAPPTPAVAAPTTREATSPFVGVINADRVNVRSGPGSTYYPLGQLQRGSLVNVLGSRMGWYQISPPTGVYCLVAKELVDVAADSKSATVKVNTANVRAGSALSPGSDYAVIGQIHKGTAVTVLGEQDKYLKIEPPAEKVYVYVAPHLVKTADAGTTYSPATLVQPSDIASGGDAGASTQAAAVPENTGTSTTPIATTESTTQSAGPNVVVVKPQPTTAYSQDAYAKFTDLNKQLQNEFQKPLLKRQLDSLLKEFQTLVASTSASPSVKQGSALRVATLEKAIQVQKLASANTEAERAAFDEQRKALDQQWQQSQNKMTEYEAASPYLAEGRLQTSSALQAKYVLVSPDTGRVVAYLDPQGEIDIAPLLGQYVGVKGAIATENGVDIKVIKVKTATLLKQPGK